MDKKNFDIKLKEKFGSERYKVLHYGLEPSENCVFQCLDCGRRIEVKMGDLFSSRRKHICSKCHYKRKDILQNEEILSKRLLNNGHSTISFFMKKRKGVRHNMVSFVCGKCGRTNEKEVANLLRQKYDCSFCEGKKEGKDTDTFIAELRERYGESLTLVSEYLDARTNIAIRCNNCGFIRQVKPNAILASGYCPKCSKSASKGEKFIKKFLEQANIEFYPQKYFPEWEIGIHYFDFYIPKFNLVLEFHGRQHYEFVPHFHKTIENFQSRCKKDYNKKEAALSHGYNYVSISYHIKNLENVLYLLFNSTTIPEGSRGKCLEIETDQDIG